MPFVPVIRYWDTAESISSADLKAALRGTSSAWPRVLISTGDRAALEAALGITIADTVREASPNAIIAAVKKGKTLGILRASDVGPSVRALGIDGRELFGNDRVEQLGRWPLVAQVETTAGSSLGPGGDLDDGRGRRLVHRPWHLRAGRATATRASTTRSPVAPRG